MPVTPTYPGVYIEELPSGVRTITGVSTSIAAFVGSFQKGPMGQPVRVLSFSDFEREFGGLDISSDTSYAIRQFFLNGGSRAWVIRVAGAKEGDPSTQPRKASVQVLEKARQNPGVFMTLSARSEGAWGNGLRVRIDHNMVALKRFNLAITLHADQQLDAPVLVEEQFINLTGDPSDARYYADVLREESTLIEATAAADDQSDKLPAPNGTCGKSIENVDAEGQHTFRLRVLSADADDAEWITVTFELESATTTAELLALRSRLEQAVRRAGLENGKPSLAGASVDFAHGSMIITLDRSAPDYRPDAIIDIEGVADPADHVTSLLGFAGTGISENLHEYSLGRDAPSFDASVQIRQGERHSGQDGIAPGADDLKRGIRALELVDLFNLLCIPEAALLEDPSLRAVYTVAIDFCEKKRAFLLIDLPGEENTYAEARDWLESHNDLRSKNAAAYFPAIHVPDPEREYRPRRLGTSGTMAGIYARTDRERGVWKAPAGTEAGLRGVNRLDAMLNDAENGVLNPMGLNVLRNFRVHGNVAWGARTLRGADALADQWKYVPVRRLALFLEESLYRGTQWVVFEPNDEQLWSQIRLNIGGFMHDLFRQGAFQGQKAGDAYLVKCDRETTTQSDINKGIVNVLVGFAPLKPAEFVILKIQQLAGQIQT